MKRNFRNGDGNNWAEWWWQPQVRRSREYSQVDTVAVAPVGCCRWLLAWFQCPVDGDPLSSRRSRLPDRQNRVPVVRIFCSFGLFFISFEDCLTDVFSSFLRRKITVHRVCLRCPINIVNHRPLSKKWPNHKTTRTTSSVSSFRSGKSKFTAIVCYCCCQCPIGYSRVSSPSITFDENLEILTFRHLHRLKFPNRRRHLYPMSEFRAPVTWHLRLLGYIQHDSSSYLTQYSLFGRFKRNPGPFFEYFCLNLLVHAVVNNLIRAMKWTRLTCAFMF